MSDLHHAFTDVFQRPGTTTWRWPAGEREHCWVYSFRPFQANERGCEILRHFTVSDNNLAHTEFFVVRVSDGNNYRLSAAWVVG